MKERKILSKLGKWGPIVGAIWLASHILVPLALLRIPIFHKYLMLLSGLKMENGYEFYIINFN